MHDSYEVSKGPAWSWKLHGLDPPQLKQELYHSKATLAGFQPLHFNLSLQKIVLYAATSALRLLGKGMFHLENRP